MKRVHKYRLSPYRVLLVDDHEPLAKATAELMRQAGLEVRIVSTGGEAPAIAAIFKPEIVLCDMRLPDMSGLEVAKVLRRTLGTGVLIAIHTAFSDSDLRLLECTLEEPVNMYLSKPLTTEKIDELASKLKALQPSRMEQPRREKNLAMLKPVPRTDSEARLEQKKEKS